VILRRVRAALVLWLSVVAGACSSGPTAVKPPEPQIVLQAIPPADPAQFERIQDMRNWRNPYLIVRSDGVALLDSADSAEIILKTDEVLPALAQLPVTRWPYGRVVAVTENEAQATEQDRVAIRRNKGIVGGILENAHVAVKWAPSA
jgi:hypothetical protein